MMSAAGDQSNGKMNNAFEAQSVRMGQLPTQSGMSTNAIIEKNDQVK